MSSDLYLDSNSINQVNSIFNSIMLIVIVISIVISILTLVSMWKIYKKALKPGWGSIVPFYSQYLLFDIAFGKGWYFLLLIVPIVGIVYSIMLPFKLANAFGKSNAFGCGLLFLPFIFYPILAFGNSRFQNKGLAVNPIENYTVTPKVEYNSDSVMPPKELNPALASLQITPKEPVNNTESQINNPTEENSISNLSTQISDINNQDVGINNQGFSFTNFEETEVVKPKPEDNTLNLRDLISATMVESTTNPVSEEQPQPVIIPDQEESRKN